MAPALPCAVPAAASSTSTRSLGNPLLSPGGTSSSSCTMLHVCSLLAVPQLRRCAAAADGLSHLLRHCRRLRAADDVAHSDGAGPMSSSMSWSPLSWRSCLSTSLSVLAALWAASCSLAACGTCLAHRPRLRATISSSTTLRVPLSLLSPMRLRLASCGTTPADLLYVVFHTTGVSMDFAYWCTTLNSLPLRSWMPLWHCAVHRILPRQLRLLRLCAGLYIWWSLLLADGCHSSSSSSERWAVHSIQYTRWCTV